MCREGQLIKGLEHKSCKEHKGVFSLEKRSLRRDITAPDCLNEGRSQVGVGRFFHETSDRVIGNGLNLHQRKFRLAIRKNFLTERVVHHWNRLHRDVVESPLQEGFKRR